MAGVNKAIILGRLGQDPEMTYTQGGLAVCKFSLATSRKMKDGAEITQWHRCTAFGRAGEIISGGYQNNSQPSHNEDNNPPPPDNFTGSTPGGQTPPPDDDIPF